MPKKIRRSPLPFLLFLPLIMMAFSCASSEKQDPATRAADEPIWTITDTKTPESAYFDAKTGVLFISNVAGAPDQKDGKGWITRLDPNGNVLDAQWITGLNAPKGMRASQGVLWVADIDHVVSIDIVKGSILKKIKAPGAKFLNDVAIGARGEVYVSDMFANRIYVIRNNRIRVLLEGPELEGPNGLLFHDRKLIVASWGKDTQPDFSARTPGRLYQIDLNGLGITPITPRPLGNLDGLEMDRNGNYLVSDWMAGKVYRVTPKGEASLILQGFKGSADLGWIPETTTLIVPRMMEDMVSAYQLSTQPK